MEQRSRAVSAGAGIRRSPAAYLARIVRIVLMLPIALLWFLHHGRSARQCALSALESRPAGSGGDSSGIGRAGAGATPATAAPAYGATQHGFRGGSGGGCGFCPIAPFCRGSGDRGSGEQE